MKIYRGLKLYSLITFKLSPLLVSSPSACNDIPLYPMTLFAAVYGPNVANFSLLSWFVTTIYCGSLNSSLSSLVGVFCHLLMVHLSVLMPLSLMMKEIWLLIWRMDLTRPSSLVVAAQFSHSQCAVCYWKFLLLLLGRPPRNDMLHRIIVCFNIVVSW